MPSKVSVSGLVEARVPQVGGQVQRMETAIAQLRDRCNQVEDRIGAILLPAAPCDPDDQSEKSPVVPLAQELERLTNQINGIAFAVENMLSRIEL